MRRCSPRRVKPAKLSRQRLEDVNRGRRDKMRPRAWTLESGTGDSREEEEREDNMITYIQQNGMGCRCVKHQHPQPEALPKQGTSHCTTTSALSPRLHRPVQRHTSEGFALPGGPLGDETTSPAPPPPPFGRAKTTVGGSCSRASRGLALTYWDLPLSP
jgi:hypothetical protein